MSSGLAQFEYSDSPFCSLSSPEGGSYTVDFEVVCEGSPTVAVDDRPSDDGAASGDGGEDGGFPLAGAGVGSFTADGESFDNVEVYACEPFSFGSDPDPRDVSLLGYLGGSSGLEVEISYNPGIDITDGSQFDQVNLNVFHSRNRRRHFDYEIPTEINEEC